MRLRFVHTADLHLDSPFTGLKSAAPDNVARLLYEATFDAYTKVIDLCITEQVDALLVAGDIYDGADRSFRAQHKFIAGLQQLDDAGIRSFVCHGNHDPLDGWEARLAYPPGCHRFSAEFESAPVFQDDPDRAVVYGISYSTRDVYDNLVRRLGPVRPGPYRIGLLHANVGNNPDHGAYAPCTLDDLAQSGIDYWALGHVHTRQVLRDLEPAAVYPGNPQGRHANETGPRGAYLVEVDDDRRAHLDFRSLDTVRWERLEVDISAHETDQDMVDAIHDEIRQTLDSAEGRPIVVRMTLTGRGDLNRSLRRSDTLDGIVESVNEEWSSQSPFAWCERIENATASPFDRDARLRGSDFLAEVLETTDRAGEDIELLTRLQSDLSNLFQHHRFRRHLSDAAPDDDDFAVMLAEAEDMVVDLLAEDDA